MADPRHSPSNNVYTILVALAFVASVAGLIYVIMRHNALFGDYNVFAPTVSAVVDMVRTGMG